jgi:hypothetical protein
MRATAWATQRAVPNGTSISNIEMFLYSSSFYSKLQRIYAMTTEKILIDFSHYKLEQPALLFTLLPQKPTA